MRDPSAAQFFKITHFFCHGHFQWAPQNRTQAHVLNQERGKDKPAMIPQETKVWKKYCQADTCCLACISFNSQALTARCLCPGSFCTAYCSSGTSAVWLSLAFSPVGAADTFPSPATCSPRMETYRRLICQWRAHERKQVCVCVKLTLQVLYYFGSLPITYFYSVM